MAMTSLRVAASSQIDKVGSAIVRFLQEGADVELVAMGAGAVNQALKSVIKARGFAAPAGMDLLMRPGFRDVEMDGKVKSVVCIHIVVVR